MNFRFSLLIAFILCTISCIELSSTVELNADGSGSITLRYIIADALFTFAQYEGNESQVTLPINKFEFERLAATQDGIDLRRYRKRRQDENWFIEAILDFENVQSLKAIYGEDLHIGRSRIRIPLVIGLSNIESIPAEYENNLLFNFEFAVDRGIEYNIIGHNPQEIQERTGKNQQRIITFSYSVKDIVGMEEASFIELVWVDGLGL